MRRSVAVEALGAWDGSQTSPYGEGRAQRSTFIPMLLADTAASVPCGDACSRRMPHQCRGHFPQHPSGIGSRWINAGSGSGNRGSYSAVRIRPRIPGDATLVRWVARHG
jgi:hypothetical protein